MKKLKIILIAFMIMFSGVSLFVGCDRDEDKTYSIIVANIENGIISVSKQEAKAGEEINISIIPNEGYELEKLLCDEREIQSTTITMPAKDITISATFIGKFFLIDFEDWIFNYTRYLTVDAEFSYSEQKYTARCGDVVTIKNDLPYEYFISDISSDQVVLTREDNDYTSDYKFVMPAQNVKISRAVSEKDLKNITVVGTAEEFVSVDERHRYDSENAGVSFELESRLGFPIPCSACQGDTVRIEVMVKNGYRLNTITNNLGVELNLINTYESYSYNLYYYSFIMTNENIEFLIELI